MMVEKINEKTELESFMFFKNQEYSLHDVMMKDIESNLQSLYIVTSSKEKKE